MKDILKRTLEYVRRRFRRPLPPDFMNFEHNRALWNRYAQTWRKDEIPLQNPDIKDSERDSYVQCLGDEWGRVADIEQIVSEYIDPYISGDSVVAEIGVGGARIASRVVSRTKELWCFDISREMLDRARVVLAGHANTRFILIDRPRFSDELADTFDFLYAFDVLVHFDLHMMWKYFQEIRRVLKPGARAFLHTSNLRAPGGWKSFSNQDSYSVVRHYFISPEIVDILAERAELTIIKKSSVDTDNFYLNRDYLFVVEKR